VNQRAGDQHLLGNLLAGLRHLRLRNLLRLRREHIRQCQQ